MKLWLITNGSQDYESSLEIIGLVRGVHDPKEKFLELQTELYGIQTEFYHQSPQPQPAPRERYDSKALLARRAEWAEKKRQCLAAYLKQEGIPQPEEILIVDSSGNCNLDRLALYLLGNHNYIIENYQETNIY